MHQKLVLLHALDYVGWKIALVVVYLVCHFPDYFGLPDSIQSLAFGIFLTLACTMKQLTQMSQVS